MRNKNISSAVLRVISKALERGVQDVAIPAKFADWLYCHGLESEWLGDDSRSPAADQDKPPAADEGGSVKIGMDPRTGEFKTTLTGDSEKATIVPSAGGVKFLSEQDKEKFLSFDETAKQTDISEEDPIKPESGEMISDFENPVPVTFVQDKKSESGIALGWVADGVWLVARERDGHVIQVLEEELCFECRAKVNAELSKQNKKQA